jgi:hypothetical protein
VGAIAILSITNSYVHDAVVGHEIRSRVPFTYDNSFSRDQKSVARPVAIAASATPEAVTGGRMTSPTAS